MGKRELDPRLRELKDLGKTIYSYSKINTAAGSEEYNSEETIGCFWEFYNTYILKKEGKDSIYGLLGGDAHDCLEDFYSGSFDHAKMHRNMTVAIQKSKIKGLKFPMGESEENNWCNSVLHFMKNHERLTYDKVRLEELIIVNIGDIILQGYVDIFFLDKDDNIHIYDWKTSSKTNFGKDKIVKTGRQLTLYKMAIEAMTGKKVVETAWNMLKFCEIHYETKKKDGSPKYSKITCMRSNIEKEIRGKLGALLTPQEYMIGELKYAQGSLNFSCYPRFNEFNINIKDHYIQYNVTPELEQECIDYFIRVINVLESKDINSKNDWLIYKSNFNKNKKIAHYCTTLCGQRENCPQFKAWQLSIALNSEIVY